ncbi:MAG: bifunctional heptose 7-phosphate kinase/heptose 1-phosphate adenyltransferase [Chloroflexota bacterium]
MAAGFGALLGRFERQGMLVLGDMVADEYQIGRPSRISREAPVLILHHAQSFVRPGGATNTANNLSALSARTSVIGVIGDDAMGRRLRDALDEAGICTDGLLIDSGRPTSTKTRILAKGTQEVQQQIVRIDRVDDRVIEGTLRDRMIDAIRRALPDNDALLVSDYENGVISQEVIDACLPEARRRGLTVTVDSHGDLFRFQDITAATPNQPEAEATLHRNIENDEQLAAAGAELLEGMNSQGVLITRGSEGVVLFERDRPAYRLPISMGAEAEVVDPTGAGDTVAAVFTLALAAGAEMRSAAFLGNLAGGEVVRKLGAATLRRDELLQALERTHLQPPA